MHFSCNHFGIRELIPPPHDQPARMREVYRRDPDDLFRCFPWRFLVSLDRLRELFGTATVNTWPFGGDLRFCGYRPWGCREGAQLSEHRFFRAGDMHFQSVTPPEVWAYMLRNPAHPAFEFIERIEAFAGMTWFHFDLGQHDLYGQAIRVITVTDNRAGLPGFIERAA